MKMGPLLHITHHRRLWRHPHYQHRSAIKVVSDEVGYHHRLKPSLKMVITVGSFYGPTIIIIKKWKKKRWSSPLARSRARIPYILGKEQESWGHGGHQWKKVKVIGLGVVPSPPLAGTWPYTAAEGARPCATESLMRYWKPHVWFFGN